MQKCAAGIQARLQVKPTDAKCLPKGAGAKLAVAVAKSCGKAPLTRADVLGASGLWFDALGAECTAIGGSSLTSLDAFADCVARRHACRVDQMLENQMPRLRELLTVGGVTLPDRTASIRPGTSAGSSSP